MLVGLVFLFSCTKKGPIAPDLGVISGPVDFGNPFAVSNANPNFNNNDQIYFGATFNKETHWLITVKGNTSGAVKRFEGTGTVISIANSVWDGTADSVISFRAEAVTAKLSFPSANPKPNPLILNITILGKKNGNYGNVLVTDFSATKFSGAGADPNIYWPSDFVATFTNNDIPNINPDGNPYCTMGPYGAWQPNPNFPGHNSPYIDFLTISANSVGYPTYFPLIADPTKIYFNIMMYNSVLPTNTWFNIILHEDYTVGATTVTVPKTITIKPNWNTGWKLISVPYLNFKLTDTTQTINNPQKIRDVQFVLLSNAPQVALDAGPTVYQVSANFDHVIFSQYKPYQP